MDTNKILQILGCVFIVFFIVKHFRIVVPSTSTTVTSVRHFSSPSITNGVHYNTYKRQYYN